MKKIPVIAVVGPTASGKTSLSIQIAKHFNGQVVSADSMQIYENMDIATAKPTKEEMDGIKHHLIGFVNPETEYSVASFCSDAKKIVDDIVSRNKTPILVGGTGLYIDSFINNTEFFAIEFSLFLIFFRKFRNNNWLFKAFHITVVKNKCLGHADTTVAFKLCTYIT